MIGPIAALCPWLVAIMLPMVAGFFVGWNRK
jgi:ABC-type dipeptide/oligopeptide/nickel transport system permease subunit